jgi:RES domain-containing protein
LELIEPPRTAVQLKDTHRLIPSRYPPVGIFDAIATPEDLPAIVALEGWTNDRISAELGAVHRLPRSEWVLDRPMASVIMAAFCHPHPRGGRFNSPDLGAWYAAKSLDTAHAEIIHHRTRELEEIGVRDARVQMRDYLADLDGEFHDIRGDDDAFAPLYDPDSYAASQAFAAPLRASGSNGVLFRSVRRAGGECVACFRPRLVMNVRQAEHFEYRWAGARTPAIVPLAVK